ncbi:uncharacterized protein LOC110702001 [Chenopodium quinoa]|uniref:uncharacterized protein LOC110702001 n=1 Tax=Chenopodium quinoa TaxID=63459 RepID=UPI000B76DECD|nr:uncharacterized protein LOC110702001 [Chenopodium quinoa]
MESQDSGGGGMVDEDMIVLRLRIKELEMMEKGEEVCVPSNWFEWEKKHIIQFQGGVHGAIGFLQLVLMNSRPSLALGIMAYGILSVLFSNGLLTAHIIEMINEITAKISPF